MWISAAEATKLLDVTRQTLYAYVSRGLIRSEAVPGQPRVRRYAREDVERLQRRAEERRDPSRAAAGALQWGVPVLESSITLITEGKLYYRGHDVETLARTRSIAEVASLLWTGGGQAILPVPHPWGRGGFLVLHAGDLPFMARAQSLLPSSAAHDPLAFDLRPQGVAATGWRIVNLLTSIAAETKVAPTIDETLAGTWKPRSAALLRAAIIVCADHELNVSAFTARCIASSGANPYSVVLGALCALEGVRHGGATARVEALLDELRRARDPRRALANRLRRGETIDGFGHPLYPKGDPRAKLLLTLLAEHSPKSKELAFLHDAALAAHEVLGERPTVDFALVALQRALALPAGSALTLFAIGRTMGWIAHAIEQYSTNAPIRPRAKYVGALPER
jgi:citrate synthase